MLKNETFIEKYRPQTFNEIVGIDKQFFETILKDPQKLPHIILYSNAPGTGKTTIARVIIKTLNAEALILNASDERKIETVREKIKRFVQTKSIIDSPCPKIVFLDEFDGMLEASQDALRNMMEEYPARFILTANNINCIIEPIRSRCVKINMQYPKINDIKERLKLICEKENIKINNVVMEKIVMSNYPSIRNSLNLIYEFNLKGVKEITEQDIIGKINKYDILYQEILNNKLLPAREEWIKNNYNIRELLKHFFNLYMKNPLGDIERIIELFCETDYKLSVNADGDITLTNFSSKFISLVSH